MIESSEFNVIAALDLDPIKVKLMHKESGEGWSLAYVNEVEFEYRCFLYLMKKYPDENTAPLHDIDIFWHYHILDTMKYASDCQQVFGYFLHHFPYLGMRGEEDEAALDQAGERMRELYEGMFAESYHQPAHAIDQSGSVSDCPTGAPKAAFCSVTSAKNAFCSATSVKAAFCSATNAKNAFCSATGAKNAFCSATGIKPAFCSATGANAVSASASLYTKRPELTAK